MPIRIVYDCSCHESKDSPSLNDCLEVGLPFLTDMCSVLLRFRVGLGRILKFTFEYSLVKCSNIRSFGVSFQVTGFLVLTNILLKFYLSSPI